MRARQVATWVSLSIALTLSGCYARARVAYRPATVSGTVSVNVPDEVVVPAPPPPLQQAAALPPQPGPNAVWVPGHYHWEGGWRWVPGHWEPNRGGQRWVPPVAHERGGSVVYHAGYWQPEEQEPPPVYATPGTVRVAVRPPPPQGGVVHATPGGGRPPPQSGVVHATPGGGAPPPQSGVVHATPGGGAPPPQSGVVHATPGGGAPPPQSGVVHATPGGGRPPPQSGVVHATPGGGAPPPRGGVVRATPGGGSSPSGSGNGVTAAPGRSPGTVTAGGSVGRVQQPGPGQVQGRVDTTPSQPSGGVVATRPNPQPAPRGGAPRRIPLSCRVGAERAPMGGVVAVTGTGFTASTQVSIGGHLVSVVARRDGMIQVRVPSSPGGGAVRVTQNGQSASCGTLLVGAH